MCVVWVDVCVLLFDVWLARVSCLPERQDDPMYRQTHDQTFPVLLPFAHTLTCVCIRPIKPPPLSHPHTPQHIASACMYVRKRPIHPPHPFPHQQILDNVEIQHRILESIPTLKALSGFSEAHGRKLSDQEVGLVYVCVWQGCVCCASELWKREAMLTGLPLSLLSSTPTSPFFSLAHTYTHTRALTLSSPSPQHQTPTHPLQHIHTHTHMYRPRRAL